MGHEDCNGWEYTTHPDYQKVVDVCAAFLTELRLDPASKASALEDTREYHRSIFSPVAPSACSYLAGNYRGSNFDCLREYGVVFGGTHGTLPIGVFAAMDLYHGDLLDAVRDLDQAVSRATKPLAGPALLVRLVQVAASFLTRFFTIHPYANGNGHMGRLVVWVLLARYNRLPVRWWLHRSPPAYGPLLSEHRAGRPKALERYLLECILG